MKILPALGVHSGLKPKFFMTLWELLFKGTWEQFVAVQCLQAVVLKLVLTIKQQLTQLAEKSVNSLQPYF